MRMHNSSLTSFGAVLAFANTALALPLSDLVTRANPVPRLIQYVQTFHTQSSSSTHLNISPLVDQGTGVTHVILAALHINGPNGDITLNDNNPNSSYYDQTWSEVAHLQSKGVKVMMMVGGAAKGSFNGRLCNSNDGTVQDAYYKPMVSTYKYHKLNGIDLDIEESTSLACAQNLVNRLRSDFGSDFIITMAPVASDLTTTGGSALSGFSYYQFDRSAAGKNLNWYNGQYYSGFVQGSLESSYESAIRNGYSADRVVMGVLDASSDGSGFVSLKNVQETVENLHHEYSNFGGADGWEYFNAGSSDGLSQPYQWTKAVGQAVFATSTKKAQKAGKAYDTRSIHPHHTPTLPKSVEKLMSEGHDQIAAARAMRLAGEDEEKAREILAES